MLVRGIYLFYVSLWCMAVRSHLVISQEHSTKFQLADDVRYECGGLYTLKSRSRLICAAECTKEVLCSAFNFGGRHCELLSAAASCRTSVSGWTHGSSPEYFFLKNHGTGNCLNVDGFPGIDNCDNVNSYQCEFGDSNSDQIWSMDNYGRLISRPSGKCLDVPGYISTLDETHLILYTCEEPNDPFTDHIWKFEFHEGTRYFRIRNVNTNKCVDTVGISDPSNGVNVQQYRCLALGDGVDQWWEQVFIDI